MLRHVVMYKLKENTKENKQALVDKFLSMKGKIDVLLDINSGLDTVMSERSYDVVLETLFKNKEAMAEYLEHPVHQDVRSYVRSVVEKSHSVDYIIKDTYARIELEDGRSMTMKLFKDKAPISVANFVELANNHFFDGLIFHRVIPHFMIQGGGMYENMQPKEGAKPIKGEFQANGVANSLTHTLGTVSMARTSNPNSASSQFFICVDDTPHLDGQYAAFGRLDDKESIKVAIDISKVKTHSIGYYDDIPCDPIKIKQIVIYEE